MAVNKHQGQHIQRQMNVPALFIEHAKPGEHHLGPLGPERGSSPHCCFSRLAKALLLCQLAPDFTNSEKPSGSFCATTLASLGSVSLCLTSPSQAHPPEEEVIQVESSVGRAETIS